MKIFLAGATGVVGRKLVPLLVSRGHQVVGTTRSPGKQADLRTLGAEPVLMDALDRAAVRQAVLAARPEVVVHQLTDLSNMHDLKHWDEELAGTNRLRTEASTTCWPPRANPAPALSSPKATPAGPTRAAADPSKPKRTRSTPTRRNPWPKR